MTNDDVAKLLEESRINPNPVMAVLSIGLTPILPTIEVVPVVETPDFARITKLPAVPRFTAAGPAALTACDRNKINTIKPYSGLCNWLTISTTPAKTRVFYMYGLPYISYIIGYLFTSSLLSARGM